MDTLTGIRIFCSVVERGSFAAAARSLDLSTALVSKHVMRLEQRLGARLLNRSSRHVSLTEAGATYFQHCHEMLEALDDTEAQLTSSRAQPRGTLKLSAPVWMASGRYVDLFAGYQRRHPEVQLDIDLSSRAVNLVEERYDLALRVSAHLGDTLIARPIGRVSFLLVAAPSYLRQHGRPQQVDDLFAHSLLGYSEHPPKPADFGLPAKGPAFQIALQSNNETLLHLAALRGLGIVLLPDALVETDIANGNLEALFPQLPLPTIPLHAVYASRRQLPTKVRSFIDFLCVEGGLGITA